MTSAESKAPPQTTALSPRARLLLPIMVLALAAVSIHRYCAQPPRTVVSFEGATMGTTWSVKIATTGLPLDIERARIREITAALDRVDGLMSTWKPESELSRFNRHEGGVPFPVSPETLAVFEIATEVSELTAGAFDVTVGPLVAVWGFGAGATARAPPSTRELEALLGRVGFRNVSVDAQAGTLEKTSAEVVCDLSAIAKGFAVDEVARVLSVRGHENFLVEVGGELRARGAHLDGSPWRVAIETPLDGRRSIHRIVELRDLAMATSGDYRNYYEQDGRRISHTIDPRTGQPITHALASVTVLHPDAAHADALATALDVLGPEAGYHFANAHSIAAYFIVRDQVRAGAIDQAGFNVRMTKNFEPLLVQEP